MNVNATLEKLNAMRLYGFEQANREVVQSTTHNEFTVDELIARFETEHPSAFTGICTEGLREIYFLRTIGSENNFPTAHQGQPAGVSKC